MLKYLKTVCKYKISGKINCFWGLDVMNSKTIKHTYLIYLLIIFALMLYFNILTPMVSDDFAHYYGVEDVHVTTVQGILHSMGIFRIYANGRIISHFLVYLFLALPRIVFQVANALVSTCIIAQLSRYVLNKKSVKEFLLLVGASCALWLLTPSFGEVYLWLSGSLNYSWGLLLDLLFIFPFYCNYTERKQCRLLSPGHMVMKILFPLLAFVVGAYSENGAAASICVAGLLWLLIWIKNKKFPWYLFFALACAAAGFLFLISAPATLTTRVGGNVREHIWYCRVLTVKYMTILWCVYIILLFISILLKVEKRIIVFTTVLLFASILSIAVFIFAIYLPPRSFMIAVTFSVLAICCLIREMWIVADNNFLLLIPAVTAFLFLFSFPKGFQDILYLNELQKDREMIIENAKNAQEKIAYIPRFVTNTDFTACPEEELSEDGSFWYNNLVANYYGIEAVVAIPDK